MSEEITSKFTKNMSAERDSLRMFSGQQNHYVVDVSAAAVTIDDDYKNCRYVEVDTAGLLKLTYTDDLGHERTETKYMIVGYRWMVQNVTYVDDTITTTTAYKDDGSAAVKGCKLRY